MSKRGLELTDVTVVDDATDSDEDSNSDSESSVEDLRTRECRAAAACAPRNDTTIRMACLPRCRETVARGCLWRCEWLFEC